MINDTIAAVSTPRGKGGIAVIRISGEASCEVLARAFRAVGTPPAEKPRRAVYGTVVNGGEKVDTGIAVFYKGGASYTGEDSAEISCHGGVAVTAAVLEAVFAAGARPAEAGEFTRRAFLNGKLSLTEAEAVGRLIDADTDSRRRLASGAAQGKLREMTDGVRGELTHVLSALYAAIDYPEEDVGDEGERRIGAVLENVRGELSRLLSTYRTGRAVADGVVTAVVGSPNSGKSSLYNLLCRDERAIVTDIAGTTRDTLWETVDVGGITLRLADTAGIRETPDKVEKLGVMRARDCMESAELIIAVFDGSKSLSDGDRELIGELKKAPGAKIAVINKSDLEICVNESEISASCDKTVVMSAKTGDGAQRLNDAVSALYNSESLSLDDDTIIWDARHKATLESVISLLSDALAALASGDPLDAVCTLAESALAELSLLDGRGVTEDIVSEIFSRFCVGK